MNALRIFVTGTDTGVGKTRATATLARALASLGRPPHILKAVQTGLPPGVPGDAAEAGALAGLEAAELDRYALPADPFSAALAAGIAPPRAADLSRAIDRYPGDVLVEGAGGLLVPLNAEETLADLAVAARLRLVLVVGLRLGCMNHALLTLEAAARRDLAVLGAILVACDEPPGEGYLADVERVLQGKTKILGILPHESPSASAVERDAAALRAHLAPFL